MLTISLIFHLTDEDWIQGRFAWNGAIACRIKELMIHGMMKQRSPFDTEVKIKIPFINMNVPYPVDVGYGLGWIFTDESIHNGLPAAEGVAKVDTVRS